MASSANTKQREKKNNRVQKTPGKKENVGCLLIHGFTGSPNELLELGAFLEKNGLNVSIPTLPGHGTYSGDLFNYTWQDWFDCVKREYALLSNQCEEVFVCGLSMGGTLALHLAAHTPVAGVIALSAAVDFPQWKVQGAKVAKKILKFRQKRGGEDVHAVKEKAKLGSYRRYPYYAVDQLFQLVRHVREDLPEVNEPLLVMHSELDHTVKFHNAQMIFDAVRSADKHKVDLQNSFHVITVDDEKKQVQAEVLRFIRKHSKSIKPTKPPVAKKKSPQTRTGSKSRAQKSQKSGKGFMI